MATAPQSVIARYFARNSTGEGVAPAEVYSDVFTYCLINCNTCFSSPLCKCSQYYDLTPTLSKGEGAEPSNTNHFYFFTNCNTCFSSPLCKCSQYLPAAKFCTGILTVWFDAESCNCFTICPALLMICIFSLS